MGGGNAAMAGLIDAELNYTGKVQLLSQAENRKKVPPYLPSDELKNAVNLTIRLAKRPLCFWQIKIPHFCKINSPVEVGNFAGSKFWGGLRDSSPSPSSAILDKSFTTTL